ncbi:PepSY-associated TM helix domain-containing protein [Caldibacillus thermoamylovorans]
MEQAAKPVDRQRPMYMAVWRWHFYAGIFFAPFLIILALSGAVYLFKPQIESALYGHLYEVDKIGEKRLPLVELTERVKKQYPHYPIVSVTLEKEAKRTVKIGMMDKGEMVFAFVNPYTGKIQGTLRADENWTEIAKKIHSELLIGGTLANRFVELAACWGFVLLVTGLYLWWPRQSFSVFGTFWPRWRAKKRLAWRDWHAVTGIWMSGGILLLIVTGMPWTGIMGEAINQVATATNTGYPPFAFSFGPKPESKVTKEVAQDVPWATEQLPVPSVHGRNTTSLSIDDVYAIAEEKKVKKPFTISLPEGPKGVFTVATSKTKPWDNATLHIDQYSGRVLSDVRFSDYGALAKAITIGIAFHEGRLFGLANQLINLVFCLGLIFLAVSGWVMWRKRKPKGLGAPARVRDPQTVKTVWGGMIAAAIVMPLFALSLLFIWLFDRLIVPRVPKLREFLAA